MPQYPDLRLFVAGDWKSAEGAPVINPADESILGTVPHASRAEISTRH
jgi:succinate-semialdehyde dehydrogenase / glutarate-semialdehyde dehydrogenase